MIPWLQAAGSLGGGSGGGGQSDETSISTSVRPSIGGITFGEQPGKSMSSYMIIGAAIIIAALLLRRR